MHDPDDLDRSPRFPPGWWVPVGLLCVCLGMLGAAVFAIAANMLQGAM